MNQQPDPPWGEVPDEIRGDIGREAWLAMDEVALATDAVRQRDYSDDPGGGERDLMSIAIITHNTTLKLIGKLAREVEQLRQEVASLK